MSKVRIQDTTLTSIGDAIRDKLGVTTTYKPSEMPDAISQIEGSGGGTKLVPWASGSDEEIAEMLNAYYAGDITLEDVKTVWSIGDSRTVSLSAINPSSTDYPSEDAQDIELVILDFEHDDLTFQRGDKTKALITVQQKNSLNTTGMMQSYTTYAVYWYDGISSNCYMRTWCQTYYYDALPVNLKNLIKQVNKIGSYTTNMVTSYDYCFLLSETEVFGENTISYGEQGTQYPYYQNSSNRIKMCNNTMNKWWLRSPYTGSNGEFCCINTSGVVDYNYSNSGYGIAPAFCL